MSGDKRFGSNLEKTPPPFTDHAARRMAQRGISRKAVLRTLRHGRRVYIRGACLYAVGKREVHRSARRGVDLTALDGIHVVCSDGVVLTVYRNRALNLRGRKRPRRPPDVTI